MTLILTWFLYFIIYSVFGYLMETVFCSITARKFVGRGFLFGPWCPMYGFVAIALLTLTHFWQAPNIFVAFLVFMLICAGLEYLASYLLEKIFGLKWWDYSGDTPLNLNGRICFEATVIFGLASVFLVYVIQPELVRLVSLIPETALYIIAPAIFVIFAIDLILSTIATAGIRHKVDKSKSDMTQEIKKLVMAYYTKAERELRRASRQIKRELKQKQRIIQKDLKIAEEKIGETLHLKKK